MVLDDSKYAKTLEHERVCVWLCAYACVCVSFVPSQPWLVYSVYNLHLHCFNLWPTASSKCLCPQDLRSYALQTSELLMACDVLIITLSIVDWTEPSNHINHPLTVLQASRHYPRAERQIMCALILALMGKQARACGDSARRGIMPKMSSKRAHEIPTWKAIYHTGHLNSVLWERRVSLY